MADLQQSLEPIVTNDDPECPIFCEADEIEMDEERAGEIEVEVFGWPADAIRFSSWLFMEMWEPGTPLPYASAAIVGQHGRDHLQYASFGPIAMAFGLCALGANINASLLAILQIKAFEGTMVLGLMCILPALFLGTLGRRSQTGRRTATLGRLCGWAAPAPILLIIAQAMKSVADLQFRILIVIFPLFGWLLVAFLITLIADGMLGTD